MSKKPQLSEKHWKAIGLIAEGKHSIKEVAEITGIGLSAMYKLVEGDTTVGSTALLFKAEIKKIHKKHAEEIRPILNTCKRKALRIIDGVLTRILALDYTSNEDAALVTTVLNALNKAPSVEINNTSYSIYNSMSSEEIMHEFNRLTSLVRGPSVRGRVQEIGSGSAEGVFSDPGQGGDLGQESEA